MCVFFIVCLLFIYFFCSILKRSYTKLQSKYDPSAMNTGLNRTEKTTTTNTGLTHTQCWVEKAQSDRFFPRVHGTILVCFVFFSMFRSQLLLLLLLLFFQIFFSPSLNFFPLSFAIQKMFCYRCLMVLWPAAMLWCCCYCNHLQWA